MAGNVVQGPQCLSEFDFLIVIIFVLSVLQMGYLLSGKENSIEILKTALERYNALKHINTTYPNQFACFSHHPCYGDISSFFDVSPSLAPRVVSCTSHCHTDIAPHHPQRLLQHEGPDHSRSSVRYQRECP